MVSMREASEILNVSYKRLSANHARWGIPATRIGGRVKFALRHLDAFIERNTETPETDLGKWLAEQRGDMPALADADIEVFMHD